MEAILNIPGFNQLRNLPLLKAALTPPVAVEHVGTVAAASAGSIWHDCYDDNTYIIHLILFIIFVSWFDSSEQETGWNYIFCWYNQVG